MSQETESPRRRDEGALSGPVSDFRGHIVRLSSVVLGLLLWELYAWQQPEYLFPSVVSIATALGTQFQSYHLGLSYIQSMATLFGGFGCAAVVGITLGVLMGSNRWTEAILTPYVNGLYVAPVVALVPILILLGGTSFWTRVFVVFLFAVFEITIDTYEGVKSVPTDTISSVRSFGAGRWYVVRHVVLPFSAPYIFTGLKLGLGRGIKGMIVAELLFEFVNLGSIIRLWANDFRLEGVLSVVALLIATNVILIQIIQRAESHVVTWENGNA